MVLRRNNTKQIARNLGVGKTETVTLLKRGDDQKEGTVTAYKLFNCRRSMIHRTGEPIQGNMTSSHTTVWHIPIAELRRVGVAYLSAADRIVNHEFNLTYTWIVEADTNIDEKLFGNEIDLSCKLFNQVNT